MATLTLDEILFDMSEPERTKALETFMSEEETVLLKASKGSFVEKHRGKTITVPPRGLWCSRRQAVDLLLSFGKQGKYMGKDRKTGHTQQTLDAMEREEYEFWTQRKGVAIREQYLYHDPKDQGTEEEIAAD